MEEIEKHGRNNRCMQCSSANGNDVKEKKNLESGNEIVFDQHVILFQCLLLVAIFMNENVEFAHVVLHVTNISIDVFDLILLRINFT